KPTDRATGNEPIKCNPWVITRDTRRISSCTDRNPFFKHQTNGWRVSSFLGTVAVHKIFTLIGHSMLDRDAAAKHLDAFDITYADCLGMVYKPVQPIQ